MTVHYAVMGNPIAHSKSPLIHRLFASQLGEPIIYEKILVPIGGLKQAIAEFQAQGGKGLNITLPFKEEAFELAEELGAVARLAGAVNTLTFGKKLQGDNTDGIGLLRDLEQNKKVVVDNKKILVLGAGGAVRGILPVLLSCKPANIVVANRTLEKARILVERFKHLESPITAVDFNHIPHEKYDLIFNGISSHLLKEAGPELPSTLIHDQVVAYDLVYADERTPFENWALDNGATRVFNGLGMLVEQAAESYFIWRGQRPNTEPVIRALSSPPCHPGI